MEISLVFQEHPDDEIWEEYIFGRVDPRREAAIEEHLLLCARCQDKLAWIDEYHRSMKAATAQLALSRPKQRWRVITFQGPHRPARVASFAVVAAIAALLWIGPMHWVHGKSADAATAPVALESLRAGSAAASMGRAPAQHPLDLSIHSADLPPASAYRLELVNRSGRPVWSGAAHAGAPGLSAHVAKGLVAGTYWVRLYGDSGELLAEYGLRLE